MLQDQLIKLIKNDQLSEEEKITQLQSLVTAATDLINLNEDSESLLHMAAEQGYMVICQWLINHFPELLTAKNIRGSNVLFYAALSGNETLFDYIDSCCTSLITEENLKKRQILFPITLKGNIKLFIKVSARVPKEWLTASDSEHTFPISWAVLDGHIEIVLWILSQLHHQPDSYKEQFLEAVQVAAIHDRIEIIKKLYAMHPDWLNIPIYNDFTPIQAAAYYGRSLVVNFLLEKFPDAINNLSAWKVRLIDWAAKSGSLELVRQLANRLDKDALLHEPNSNGWYLLHYAVKSGDTELVECLLKWGADVQSKITSNASFIAHDTPAHLAARRGDIRMLTLLLRYEADIDNSNNYGTTPLHYAIIADSIETVDWLLKHGASINKRSFIEGSTAIHIAAIFGRYKLLDLLQSYGGQLNLPDNNGMYPLHLAAAAVATISLSYMCNLIINSLEKESEKKLTTSPKPFTGLELVTDYIPGILLENVALRLNRPHLSNDFYHRLILAPDDRNYQKVMQWLLEYLVNVQQVTANTYRSNACHIAAQAGQLENLILLHEHKIPINSANASGDFPIHLASRYGHQSVVAWLLQQHIDVDQLTQKNEVETPFVTAVKNNHLILLDLFKEYQANIHLPCNGCFPLSFAIKNNNPEIVKWLLQNGASINHPLAENYYALQIAAAFDSEECLDHLLIQPMQYWEQQDEYHHTPLTAALAYNSRRVLKKLLALQTFINRELKQIRPEWQGIVHHKTAYGWHPIHYLSLIEIPKTPAILDLTCVEAFLKIGININASTNEGETILHLLIKKIISECKSDKWDNYLRLISLLLKSNLNAHFCDASGATAYDYVFSKMSNNASLLDFAKLLLYVFQENGIDVNTHAITNLFDSLSDMRPEYLENFLSFVLDYFPELFTKFIDITNEKANLLLSNNIQQDFFSCLDKSYLKGILNGHTFQSSQINEINSIIASGTFPVLPLGINIDQETDVAIQLAERAIQDDDIFIIRVRKLEMSEQIFILKQLCAFIIKPPAIFTENMSQRAKINFCRIANVVNNQEAINIIGILLDKAAITGTLTTEEEKQFKELYLKLYRAHHKKVPSLLELSADAVIRLSADIPINLETKQYFNSQLTLIGSQFGRIQRTREYILNKFITKQNISLN